MSDLGKHGKDIVTGFEGVITSEHRYITGCTQYGLQPKIKDDGILPESKYFDKIRITVSGDPVKIEGVDEDPGCETRERP